MFKSLQRLLESLADFISRLIKDLADLLDKSFKPRKPVPAPIGLGPEEPPPLPDMTPLAVEPPMILVECVSCGSRGELTGICQKCHEPLCSRSFCRKSVQNVELDMEVLLCRDCAAVI